MATYTAQKYNERFGTTSPYPHVIAVPFKFYTGGTAATYQDATHTTLATSGVIVAADTLRLVKVPKGSTILGYYIYLPDLDGGTTLVWDLGLVTAGATVFGTGFTMGRAAGVVQNGLALAGTLGGTVVDTALPYTELTADDIFVMTFTTGSNGAGTTTNGTNIHGYLQYITNPSTAF